MSDIYDQHKAAFNRVSAFIVLHKGERVATIAFKYPADGAGRLYAYVHWIGLEMARGFAGGGGYDKCSAALSNAVRKMPLGLDAATGMRVDPRGGYVDFNIHASRDDGKHWARNLESAGFTVLQAV